MTILLKPNEVCPHSIDCKYNDGYSSICKGADSSRLTKFVCDFMTGKNIVEGKFRSKFDETGRMKVITENG